VAAPERIKVAVLGGGPAAIAAAFELTSPELEDRFEVTVYQPGWRLGGKCASGRNLAEGGRIEEHGLHVWFGFYDNAFRMARAAYEELDRPPGHPLPAFERAFEGCDQLVLYDRQGGGWQDFPVTFPRNGLQPGGHEELPDFWEIAIRLCNWAVRRWESLSAEQHAPRSRVERAGNPVAGLAVALGFDSARGGEQLLRLARRVAAGGRLAGATPFLGIGHHGPRDQRAASRGPSVRARLLAGLLTRFRDWMWEQRVSDRCSEDARLRLFFTTFDTFASAIAGIARDRVLERGWETIDDRDLCEWLSAHGAKEVTVGATPAERAPLLRAVYDVAFAYPRGDVAAANCAAGTAISNLLRLLFTYRGSVLYTMRAGMGDTVIAPIYEVLARRGVSFRFFNAVTDLHLSDDGLLLEGIELVPQVELARDAYDPLVAVQGIDCWPSEPLWDQLRDGASLRQRGVNFELESNPLGKQPFTLTRGEDFDAAVLGIPVGALTHLCGEIAGRHERFARMLASAETVGTQAFQLWLTRPTKDLGWRHGENTVAGTHVEPLDTWCDMSYLLPREEWGAEERVRGLAYFCGVLDDREGESPSEATARVKYNARAFLHDHVGAFWPGVLASGNGAVDWSMLADRRGRNGSERLEAQHWRANTTGSERYVLTPAKAVANRLAPDESGVENLLLAGDWTRNGIDGGCVEAAVTSGMQAAQALIGDREAAPASAAARVPPAAPLVKSSNETGGQREWQPS
jgi:uncharacterized protein with NAD-binding domain and iron-sulfur cluster